MKLFGLSLLLLSTSVFASTTTCNYRFNPRLAVTVKVNEPFGHKFNGGMIWDDKNVCAGDICTEIYPGMFKVKYRNITPPRTLGVVIFNVKAITVRDDLGNRFHRNSLFGDFVRNAKFTTVIYPEPNLSFRWKRQTHKMDCREI